MTGDREDRAERELQAEIRALYTFARGRGDGVTAALCRRALLGDAVARGACRIAIQETWSALQEMPTQPG